MDLQLHGKTALVTGSTAGIGQAIAQSLAAEGATVLINGRSEDRVAQAINDISKNVKNADLKPAVADLSTNEGFESLTKKYPDLDILINNMGIFPTRDFFEISDSEWEHIFNVNVMSGIRLSRHYLEKMLQKKEGRIIFISSESAISPAMEMVHYSATKTTQLAISRSLAELTRGTNVTVNTILPGSTLTQGVEEMLDNLYPNEKLTLEEAEKKFMSNNRPTSIIQRLIRPKEIGDFAAYISSPLSSAINGTALRVDGGLVRSVF
ncbi:SDR family NAD(P)-dependent oxidoreductase [Sporolactobacillus laevolacticus]|uniref:Oxidoreductase n=1 Tax=Sporolactobacillus laevolacticus DSM 442 TaxID=1395513 RepID=V6J717_9BACL|nr:SDR family oxidoreductase [Sporolactobacillus laevolacticus]EST12574.1 oxidoreductase [Sporolactobacillus laevolacticus DSM 442]